MTDKNWTDLYDSDFDRILEASAADIPPAEIIRGATPHRTAINHIITGLILTTFTLNIVGLNYIGPAIGAILLASGFRIIRNGGRFLRAGYILSILHVALMALLLAINATIYSSAFNASNAGTAYGVITVAVKMSVIVCHWRGLKNSGHCFGSSGKIDSGIFMCLWYASVSVLGLLGITSWLLFGVLIAAYALLIRSLLKLSDTLEDMGYSISAAPVRVSDHVYIGILACLLILCVVCGYGFSRSYPMSWENVPDETAAESSAIHIRSEIIKAGFPDYVADDLSDDDILRFQGFTKISAELKTVEADGGKLVITTAVSFNEDDRRAINVVHHFRWEENPDHLYTEGLKIYPAYADPLFEPTGSISGHLLCEKDGETMISGYRYLGEEVIRGTDLWGTYEDTVITGTYSIPENSKNCRGYIWSSYFSRIQGELIQQHI